MMSCLEYSSLLSTAFILLTCAGDHVEGAYLVEVTLHSYRNPTGRCDQCQEGTEPGCCDETFVRPASEQCPIFSACDTLFQHCVQHTDGTMCGSFTFYRRDSNSIDLENTVHSLDNPVQVRGEEAWEGLRFALVPWDCSINPVDRTYGQIAQIDIVFIDINSPVGTNTAVQTYSGNARIVEFDVSYSVRCAEGYSGEKCDKCAGINCHNGICVGEVGRHSCDCYQGFTGDRCQNPPRSPDSEDGTDELPMAIIIGGSSAGGLLLLCACVSLLCICLVARKSKNQRQTNNRSSETPSTGTNNTGTTVAL